MDKMSSQQHHQPPYSQPKGRRSINTPWSIPHWLVLVKFLGLTTKEHGEHNEQDDNKATTTATTATDGRDVRDKDGSNDGNNNEGEVDGNSSDCNNDYDNNVDDGDDNNEDGMMTMQWQQRQWGDNNVMAMGIQ